MNRSRKKEFGELTTRRIVLISIAVFLTAALVFIAVLSYLNVRQALQSESDALSAAQQLAQIQADRIKKQNEPVYITLPGADKIQALREDYTKPDSLWALVNKSHSISLEYAPEVVIPNVPTRSDKTADERSVRKDVAPQLEKLFAAAAAEGHNLMIGSGYRSASLQQMYFNSYAATAGVEAANQLSAFPGQSEHQTGLAVDISSESQSCYLDTCFTSTPDGQWLADNAYKYGFTLRYPEDKTDITKYDFEPWHYRYVGVELATALHQSHFTLEEAWPYLEEALSTLKENGAPISKS